MKMLVAATAIMALLATPALADGDTFTVRLDGADAFETKQLCSGPDGQDIACGTLSTAALRAIIEHGKLACDITDWSYERPVMKCSVTLDVSCELVRTGWAMVDPRYSKRCSAAEAEARNAKRGAWAGTFTLPWIWRNREMMHPTPEVKP